MEVWLAAIASDARGRLPVSPKSPYHVARYAEEVAKPLEELSSMAIIVLSSEGAENSPWITITATVKGSLSSCLPRELNNNNNNMPCQIFLMRLIGSNPSHFERRTKPYERFLLP